MRATKRNEFSLEKANIGCNASRIMAAQGGAPILTATSITKAEADRYEHEVKGIQRLCKVFGLDADAVIAEMKDWQSNTDCDWRRAVTWAKQLVYAKPERLKLT